MGSRDIIEYVVVCTPDKDILTLHYILKVSKYRETCISDQLATFVFSWVYCMGVGSPSGHVCAKEILPHC